MAKPKLNFNGMNVDELLALRQKVDDQIAATAAKEVAELQGKMDKLQSFVREKPKAAPEPTKPVKRAKSRARKKPAKVSAKFRDPATGKTWSGRGMTPVWLREYEEQGKKRTQFAVK